MGTPTLVRRRLNVESDSGPGPLNIDDARDELRCQATSKFSAIYDVKYVFLMSALQVGRG